MVALKADDIIVCYIAGYQAAAIYKDAPARIIVRGVIGDYSISRKITHPYPDADIVELHYIRSDVPSNPDYNTVKTIVIGYIVRNIAGIRARDAVIAIL